LILIASSRARTFFLSDDRLGIWVPLAFTTVLCMMLLIIFECGQRNSTVGDVYDRRRSKVPARVPPPLLQRRGCSKGWLAFDWWHFKLTSSTYKDASKAEWIQRRNEQAEKQRSNRRKQMIAKGNSTLEGLEMDAMGAPDDQSDRGQVDDIKDTFVRKAEQICYKQSPFFEPSTWFREEDDNDDDNKGHDHEESSDYADNVGRVESLVKQSNDRSHLNTTGVCDSDYKAEEEDDDESSHLRKSIDTTTSTDFDASTSSSCLAVAPMRKQQEHYLEGRKVADSSRNIPNPIDIMSGTMPADLSGGDEIVVADNSGVKDVVTNLMSSLWGS
jgi:hypothetical protein